MFSWGTKWEDWPEMCKQYPKLTFACSNSTIETPEKDVKYVQSEQ